MDPNLNKAPPQSLHPAVPGFVAPVMLVTAYTTFVKGWPLVSPDVALAVAVASALGTLFTHSWGPRLLRAAGFDESKLEWSLAMTGGSLALTAAGVAPLL